MPVQHTPVYVTEAERLEQESAARQVRDLPERPRTYHIVTYGLSLIHISEPTRQAEISYAVFCLKKKNTNQRETNKS